VLSSIATTQPALRAGLDTHHLQKLGEGQGSLAQALDGNVLNGQGLAQDVEHLLGRIDLQDDVGATARLSNIVP
jgi:hypothetical protein